MNKVVMPLAAVLMFCTSAFAAAADAPAPIRLNQLGLVPNGPKRAILPHPSKSPLQWELVNARGVIKVRGRTEVFGNDALSGEHVHRIDFATFAGTGKGYRIKVGAASTRPFAIDRNLYAQLPHDALAYFYHNRAGVEIEQRFVGRPWSRPAGHPAESATCVAATDAKGNRWPGCDYSLDVTGGWYDAGDHGKYVVNGGIALWTLFNFYEHGMRTGRNALLRDGAQKIPEAGNGTSDLLDEARWQMQFMMSMQVPTGSKQRVAVGAKRNVRGLEFREIDSSGMAHHKVADEKWTSLPMRPDRDPERRVLFPPSTAATLNLAATAAQCARLFRTIDRAFSDRCLDAAARAWDAARRNPAIYAIADLPGSGGYGDEDVSDEFYWAATELLATTRAPEYRAFVADSPLAFKAITSEPSWNSTAALGEITLATHPELLPAAELRSHRAKIVNAAAAFGNEGQRAGYAVSMSGKTVWGSTSNLLNRAMLMALAFDFTGEPRFRDGVVDAMDYVLGRNPLDRSFVTGYGARPVENPHHRFWARSIDPAFPPPPPGALSGGPNSSNMSDDVAAKLKGRCAPQTCWADDIHAYSLNEVAINWNAPLMWVSAWLATPAQAPSDKP